MADPVTHSLVAALRAVPVFAAFDDSTLLKIVGASENLFWREGSTVFEKGSEAEGLYIVLSGCIRIFDVEDGRETEVVRVQPGEFFGELSLLLETTHTKSAAATQDAELMVVPKDSFQDLLASYPDLDEHLRRKIEERLPDAAAVSKSSR